MKYSYTYGWRTAPETYQFFCNGKRLNLSLDDKREFGYKIICGKAKEVEDELKRRVRKQQKRGNVAGWCICSCVEGSTAYYFTQDMMFFDRYNIREKLDVYKEWKHYVISQNYTLQQSRIRQTSGYIMSNGKQIGKKNEIANDEKVSSSHYGLVKIVYPKSKLLVA